MLRGDYVQRWMWRGCARSCSELAHLIPFFNYELVDDVFCIFQTALQFKETLFGKLVLFASC